jgi:hypothetical protein
MCPPRVCAPGIPGERKRQPLAVDRVAVDHHGAEVDVVGADGHEPQVRFLLAVLLDELHRQVRGLAAEFRVRRPPTGNVRKLHGILRRGG